MHLPGSIAHSSVLGSEYFVPDSLLVLTGEEAKPIAQLLMEYGAKSDIQDENGSCPLSIIQSRILRYSAAANLDTYCKYQSLLEILWENHGEPGCAVWNINT